MMNSNRRKQVNELLACKDLTLTPKQAYDAVKKLKLKGKRKTDNEPKHEG